MSERTAAVLLRAPRLELRSAEPAHAKSLALFFRRNREHFRPWDPPAPDDRFTAAYWQRALKRSVEDWRADRALRLHLFSSQATDEVIGRVGFSQIVRGPFQSCMLGYQLDARYEGQGLMYEALGVAIEFMFAQQGLHRLQANYLEANRRSAALLARLGFVREGLAHDYLFVAGRWRDHVLSALINPAYDASALSPTD